MRDEQVELSPYNHHLQEFVTFLKQERGFADATIVNRRRSLKPFLAWLVAQGVPLSTVSPVVITKFFTCAVAGKWKRTSVSFHVQSLRSLFRYAGSRGWSAVKSVPNLHPYLIGVVALGRVPQNSPNCGSRMPGRLCAGVPGN
jgi:site-specific recombinase XerD